MGNGSSNTYSKTASRGNLFVASRQEEHLVTDSAFDVHMGI